jgi:protein translocase SecG subunit
MEETYAYDCCQHSTYPAVPGRHRRRAPAGGRSAGISGAIAGGAETFFGKNKGRDIESKLSRYTGWCAIGFIVTSVVLVFMLRG